MTNLDISVKESPRDDTLFSEIKEQSSCLELLIANDLAQLGKLSTELKILQADLHKFLDEYYKEITPLLDELKTLEFSLKTRGANGEKYSDTGEEYEFYDSKKLDKTQRGRADFEARRKGGNEAQRKGVDSLEDRSLIDSVEEIEAKKLYKKLAKIHHPDITSSDKEIFASISDFYQKRDIASLIMLDRLSQNPSNINENEIQHLERLEKESTMIGSELDKMRIKKHNLVNSAAYNLWQKSRWQRMCGYDLVRVTKKKLARIVQRKSIEVKIAQYSCIQQG